MKFIISICLLFGVITYSHAQGSNVLSSTNGRYVFGQISEMARDQYMLDTKTGRLWQVVVDKDKNHVLQPIGIQNITWDKNGNSHFITSIKPLEEE